MQPLILATYLPSTNPKRR